LGNISPVAGVENLPARKDKRRYGRADGGAQEMVQVEDCVVAKHAVSVSVPGQCALTQEDRKKGNKEEREPAPISLLVR